MARVPNPEIGFLPCFCCGTRASLRKDAGGFLYYNCPRCGGPLNGHGVLWQERCLRDATLYGEDGQPVTKQPIAPADDAPRIEKSEEPSETAWGFRL